MLFYFKCTIFTFLTQRFIETYILFKEQRLNQQVDLMKLCEANLFAFAPKNQKIK